MAFWEKKTTTKPFLKHLKNIDENNTRSDGRSEQLNIDGKTLYALFAMPILHNKDIL